nr:ribonuclease H-like domain-containing protein [Tanacetum cinerariifolium]
GPRNQDSKNKYQDSSRRTVHVEETPSKAMVAIYGVGFDWSYMAEDEVPTNMTLMAFLDSKKNGLGFPSYNVVPPPATLVYNTGRCAPLKTDLSYSGLEEFKKPEFESYRPKSCEIESKNASEDIPNKLKEYPDALLVKGRVSDNKDCLVESPVVVEKKTIVPTIAKVEVVRPKQQEKLVRKTIRVPRKNNIYSVDMKNIVPNKSLTSLVAKTTLDDSMLWHRRLGHINFKNINKLVKDNLVRGLPSKRYKNDQTYVAGLKGKQYKSSCIRREFSIARTPQQNGVAKRKNRTLIEAARTMLADSKLPTTFWTEAVNTACYVQNRILVVKPHNKTPYELFRGRTPALSFMRPFGCHVTILNTLDHLGMFDGKADEGFFVRYYMNSKAFRVYNIRTRRVEENLHIKFLENKPIVVGDGPEWLFDIDMLTKSMNYVPAVVDRSPLFGSSPKISDDARSPPSSDAGKKHDEVLNKESGASNELNSAFENLNTKYPDDPKMHGLETIETSDDSEEKADFTNLESSINVSPTPTNIST